MKYRLGVAGAPLPADPAEVTPALAAQLAALGVRAVVTHFATPPEQLTGKVAQRVRRVLADAGISIVQTTGYRPNLVHPDASIRAAGIQRLRRALIAAVDLGAEMVITGCGSHHPTFPYGPSPLNHRPEARAALIESLREVAPAAEAVGVTLALECHVLTTLDTPAQVRQVLEAVGSPWVRANFDPVNLIGDLTSLWDTTSAMKRMWEAVGPYYARSAHVKDVRAEPELVLHLTEVAPGLGELDLTTFFSICRRLGDGVAIIVEHLPAAEAAEALRRVARLADASGMTPF